MEIRMKLNDAALEALKSDSSFHSHLFNGLIFLERPGDKTTVEVGWGQRAELELV